MGCEELRDYGKGGCGGSGETDTTGGEKRGAGEVPSCVTPATEM